MAAVTVHPLGAPTAGQTAPAASTPCAQCPWRTSNHGRRHPGSWYTKANIRRLWTGMRRGEMMSCHPTDPRNPVPDGMRPAPSNVVTRECAGAHVLIQREMSLIEGLAREAPEGTGWAIYRRLRPRGLTRDGLLSYMERITFGGVPLVGPPHKPTAMDLDHPCSTHDATALPWPTTAKEMLDR